MEAAATMQLSALYALVSFQCVAAASFCLMSGQISPSVLASTLGNAGFPRCDFCHRVDLVQRPLYFTALTTEAGVVHLSCQHCFLCEQVRVLGSGGDISNETLEKVRVQLLGIYQRLQAELDGLYRTEASRDGVGTRSQG